MGKKINVRASNDQCMFQIFKQYVHQTDRNEFYVDGSSVRENPGVIVDFQNLEHTYEIFEFLGNYWGGWNSTPKHNEMYEVARRWEEVFEAEIFGIGYDFIEFKLGRHLSDNEIDTLFDEINELKAEPNCTGGFEQLRSVIKEKSEFYIWWD